MNQTISFKITKVYYEEIYQIWLKQRSVLRRWQPLVILLLFSFAIGSFFYIKQQQLGNAYLLIPLLFLGFSLSEFIDLIYSKKRWMKDRLSSKILDKTVTFNFKKKHIQQISPYSTSEIQWNAFTSVTKVEKGLLLIPEKGIMLYLPKAAFENEVAYNLVFEKLKVKNI